MRRLATTLSSIALALAPLLAAAGEAHAAERCDAPMPADPFVGPVNLVTGNVITKLAELEIAGLPVGFHLTECSTQPSAGIPIRGVSTTLNQELMGALDGSIRLVTATGESVYVETTLPDGSAAFTTQPDDGTFLRYVDGRWVLHGGDAARMRWRFSRVAGRYYVTEVERDEGPASSPVTRTIVVGRSPSNGAVTVVHASHTGEELRFTSDAAGVHVSHHLGATLAPAAKLDLVPNADGRLASFVTKGPNGPVTTTLGYGNSGLVHSIDYGGLRARAYFLREGDPVGRVTKMTVVATDKSPHAFVRDVSLSYADAPRSTTFHAWPELPAAAKTLEFDELHRTTSVRVGGATVRQTSYDDLGRVTSEVTPQPIAQTVSFEYGPRDRVAKATRGDGRVLYQVFEWDTELGTPTRLRPSGDGDDEDTYVSYDELGRITETMLPGGETLAQTIAPDGSDPSRTVTCAVSSVSAETACVTNDAWGFWVGQTESASGQPAAAVATTVVRNSAHAVTQMTRTVGGTVVDSASYAGFNEFLLPTSATISRDGRPAQSFVLGYKQDGTLSLLNNTSEQRRIELDVDSAGLPAEYRYYESVLFGLPGKKGGGLKKGDGPEVPLVKHTLEQRAACEGAASEELNDHDVWNEGPPAEEPPPCSPCTNPPPPPQNQPPVPGAPSGGAPIPGGSSPPPFGGLSPGNGGGWNFNPPYWIPTFGWPLPGPSLASILFILGWGDGGPTILPGEGGGYLAGEHVPNIYPDNGGGSPVIQPGVGPRPSNTCLIDGVCTGGHGGGTCPDGSAPTTLGECLTSSSGPPPPPTVCLVDGVCQGGYGGQSCPGNPPTPPMTLKECLEQAPPSTPTRGYCYDPSTGGCRFVGTSGSCPSGPLQTLSECLSGGGTGGSGSGGSGSGGSGGGGGLDGGVDAAADAQAEAST